MSTITITLATIFLVAAILVGSLTESTWKNVGYTWGLLVLGAVLFGITLIL